MDRLHAQVTETGFAIVDNTLSVDETAHLLDAIERVNAENSIRRERGGVRNLLDRVPQVRELADSSAIHRLVDPILGNTAFAVRAILFDKTPNANWKVPWHQDLTIAVQRRIDVPGFGPWTLKEGVHHVQPPPAVLENMLAVRIHLDDCNEDNGPLRVIPGSHGHGRLDDRQIDAFRDSTPSVSLPISKGGVLLLRPLLLHASSAALSPAHRRVIHIEFAANQLPGGLQWLY